MDQEAIIKQIYDAFNRRDIDAVLKHFHPAVTWPNGWEGGYVHGHREVRDYWTKQWKELNPVVTPAKLAIIDESTIEVGVHQLVKNLNGDVVADEMVKHTYSFGNGLIKKMEIMGLA